MSSFNRKGADTVQDEGVDLPLRSKINFAGAGVTATDDAPNDRTTVVIPGVGTISIIVKEDGAVVQPTAEFIDAQDGIIASLLPANGAALNLDYGVAPSTIEPDDAAAPGTSKKVAREDHKHAISADVPVNVDKSANAEGVSTAFSRADHKHDVSTGTPGTIQPDDAAAEGVATSLARSDHKHAISADTAVEITDSTNAEGTSTSFARADHQHAHGNRGGGSLHALATTLVAGFMSAADKAKLDGVTPGAAAREDFQYGRDTAVPAAGTLQLQGPGRSQAGMRMIRPGTITGASLQVDAADATRSYNMEIRKNGVTVATLPFPSGTIGAQDSTFSVAFVAGDTITVFLVKTAGAGASTFGYESAIVEVTN